MKIWNYVFIAITMMLFLQFSGYKTAEGGIFEYTSVEFNNSNSPGELTGISINTSSFFSYLFTDLIATILGLGIGAGLFVTGRSDIAIKAGFATAIFGSFVPTLLIAV